MLVDARAQVQRCDRQVAQLRRAVPQERIDHRERLNGLDGIEILPFRLVGDVKVVP